MHQTKDNILIIGGESGIGYGLYKRFKEEKFNVYTSIKKKNSSIPLNKSFYEKVFGERYLSTNKYNENNEINPY